MTTRFYAHPRLGIADTAAKRVSDTLSMGLPDCELVVPIDRWHMSRTAESAHIYASAWAKIEGATQ